MVNFSKKQRKGFTVIELMIVLVIIGILVALAYPSYVNYARKAKRAEAQQLLLNWAMDQEMWRSNNPAYNGETDDAQPTYIIPDHKDYTFGFVGEVVPDATTYHLEAVADGDQAKDKARDGTPCASLRLNQGSEKFPEVCWE